MFWFTLIHIISYSFGLHIKYCKDADFDAYNYEREKRMGVISHSRKAFFYAYQVVKKCYSWLLMERGETGHEIIYCNA